MAFAHEIVVIGASAGGVESLVHLVRMLPVHLNAALFVVVHFPTDSTSYLPQILSRQKTLPVVHPFNGQTIQRGHIYAAPPDFHLIIRQRSIYLAPTPRVNGHRPAIDPLFVSAARAYGPRTVGVILSGLQDDGVAGLQAIKAAGGLAIVQDPNEALFASMPLNAINAVEVDYTLSLAQIADQLVRLVGVSDGDDKQELEMLPDPEQEDGFIQVDIADFEKGEQGNGRTSLTCPECGGVLWEMHRNDLISYRCHVGHVFSAESMLAGQSQALENALWVAVRTLEERAMLLRRMAHSAQSRNSQIFQQRFSRQAEEAEGNAALIREQLLDGRLQENSPTAQPGKQFFNPGDQPATGD